MLNLQLVLRAPYSRLNTRLVKQTTPNRVLPQSFAWPLKRSGGQTGVEHYDCRAEAGLISRQKLADATLLAAEGRPVGHAKSAPREDFQDTALRATLPAAPDPRTWGRRQYSCIGIQLLLRQLSTCHGHRPTRAPSQAVGNFIDIHSMRRH